MLKSPVAPYRAGSDGLNIYTNLLNLKIRSVSRNHCYEEIAMSTEGSQVQRLLDMMG